MLPDRVLMSLMNDRMVAKGTILEFVTDFFQDYLATDNMDDLVILLRKVGQAWWWWPAPDAFGHGTVICSALSSAAGGSGGLWCGLRQQAGAAEADASVCAGELTLWQVAEPVPVNRIGSDVVWSATKASCVGPKTALLLQARLDDRLLEFFPPQKRNLADFEAYFKVRCQS